MYQPCRNPYIGSCHKDIFYHDRTGSHHTVRRNFDMVAYDRSRTDPCFIPDLHTPCHMGTYGNMHIIFQDAVVIHGGAGIDNAALPTLCVRGYYWPRPCNPLSPNHGALPTTGIGYESNRTLSALLK